MAVNHQPTIQTQHRMRGPFQRKKATARTHPGQAQRSRRKRELQRLRKEPTQAQIAEGLAYRNCERPVRLIINEEGAIPSHRGLRGYYY